MWNAMEILVKKDTNGRILAMLTANTKLNGQHKTKREIQGAKVTDSDQYHTKQSSKDGPYAQTLFCLGYGKQALEGDIIIQKCIYDES